MTIPVVDLFAGPGGLNEGFAGLQRDGDGTSGAAVFDTIASFEMDQSACATLRLRSAYRHARDSGTDLAPYYAFLRGERTLGDLEDHASFGPALRKSREHVHGLELGPETRSDAIHLIDKALKGHASPDEPWVLVGGPPCQAYSLAGRSRRANDASFEDDKKHFLYREYLHILARFRPPVFVMENVKGLLSSMHSGTGMFTKILGDLSRPAPGLRYAVHSLTEPLNPQDFRPEDFVIRAEAHGIPQRRHRVILLGVREDLEMGDAPKLPRAGVTSVEDAIRSLPPVRSGISRDQDDFRSWLRIRERAHVLGVSEKPKASPGFFLSRGAAWQPSLQEPSQDSSLSRWLVDPMLEGVVQHVARSHMADDLIRYSFAATFALREGRSPTLADFPEFLLPRHANAAEVDRPFNDRFRVQVWERPATTVVSHIAKDGHYYIHPDPSQMRSLTVREAARLQTFPDNYLFMGNRTSQFTQVGNAVPPLLAHQIARVVEAVLHSA